MQDQETEAAKTEPRPAWWQGSYYHAEVAGRTIASVDGNNWADAVTGQPDDRPEFHAATIRLMGGPRDGQEVS